MISLNLLSANRIMDVDVPDGRRFPLQALKVRVAFIVCVFGVVVVCVFLLGELRSQILVGVRAYVGGEGLWSKAEKGAARSLIAYVHTRSENDYQEFVSSIAVPLGDKQARLELQKPRFERVVVARGFVQGRNNAQDVASMTWLFRWFGSESHMAAAIAIWTDGDAYIAQLLAVGNQLHQEIISGGLSPEEVVRATTEINAIDGRLTPLEDQFSYTLGEGARWISSVLRVVVSAWTALLLILGTWVSSLSLRRIRKSDERYRHLFSTANDAILVIDPADEVILEANGKASEYLGISTSQLKGSKYSRYWPAAESDCYRQFFEAASAKGANVSDTFHIVAENGLDMPVEVSASRTEWDGKQVVHSVFRDIRYRREAQEVARRNEERLHSLIQNLSDIIIVLTVDGRMIFHTPSAEKVLGYEDSELDGKNFFDFLHEEDSVLVRGLLTTRVEGSQAPREFRCRHRNASWIWLEAVVSNLVNVSAVGGVVLTARDISRRHILEDEVRQAQKMEAIGQLAGGIAHDFNNLMMVVQAHADSIQTMSNSDDDLRKRAETIVKATDRASGLTRQLLTIGRKQTFAPKVLDLNVVLSDIEGMLRSLLTADIQLSLKFEPALGRVNADSGQLEQIVINLMVNARDAMPRGGRVTIETANVDLAGTLLRCHPTIPPGSYVMFAVTDTGTGIEPTIRERIFDPFFSTKPKEKGTGLGLSVVYGIVKQSGGYVSVHSEVGQGSAFAIYLPRVEDQIRPDNTDDAAVETRCATATVLVAEDEDDLRTVICDFLTSRGYTVLQARNGPEAISVAGLHSGMIDLLLSDVIMPEMRGPILAKQLIESRPQMRVLYMSGYTEDALSQDIGGIYAGKAMLLQKPFRLEDLANRIREVLGQTSSAETVHS